MKTLLVFTLVLTLIFPAYCYAAPTRGVPTNDKSPIDENLVNEVMLVLADGVIEQSEIENLLEAAQFEDACDYGSRLFWSGMFGAVAGIVFGGSWNVEVTSLLLLLLLNAYILCKYYSAE